MTQYKLSGGCHCGNIRFNMAITRSPDSLSPRACDCSFCRKQGAAYLSDPNGSLSIQVKDKTQLNKYRHGSKTAEFLSCRCCGIFVGVTCQESETCYTTINSNTLDTDPGFLEKTAVSPSKLKKSEKAQRWKNLWFKNVDFCFRDNIENR